MRNSPFLEPRCFHNKSQKISSVFVPNNYIYIYARIVRACLQSILDVQIQDSEAQKCIAGLSEAMLGPAKSPHHALLALADWLLELIFREGLSISLKQHPLGA